MKRFIWAVFLLTMAISCLQEADCVDKRNNIIGISFKSKVSKTPISQSVDSIAAEGSIVRFEAPGAVTTMSLPLDYFNHSTLYTMKVNDTVYQIVFTYTSQPEYVSGDCGERYVLGALGVSEHEFDSVSVISSTPGVDANAKNIEIFK